MEENKKIRNEELQTRREFFKKAAKGVLPVLGAIALMNMPLLTQAKESEKTPMGCQFGCTGKCSGGCIGSCYGNCSGDCLGSCYGGCDGNCKGSCSGSGWTN
ncbi:MAG: Cys-Xaa-Xaa-Xaa repeat radical SAM target protein [Bacteroidales bacterium]|nr:Cys-Xaa-Xaa-Xaa repeat radical SAM target protein [Bacteroidales bacterium]